MKLVFNLVSSTWTKNKGTLRIKNIVFLSIVLFAVISCRNQPLSAIKPTYNKGGYTISITSNKKKAENSIVISGQFRDIETDKPIASGWITSGCQKILIDSLGFYYAKENAYDKVFLISTAIGYREIETEHFKAEKGDSVRINFFLVQDDRPLINCEGKLR